MTSPADIIVGYMAHPVAPTEEQIAAAMAEGPSRGPRTRDMAIEICVEDNLYSAQRWLRWLVGNTDWAISAPWIPYVQALNDATSSHRERGLRDDCAMAARCDGIILVGGRLSSGMERERVACESRGGWVIDLIHLGAAPPTGQDLEHLGAKSWREFLEFRLDHELTARF